MTTAKDLFITVMDQGPEDSVGQGDLSLALAGAELIDLVGAGAATVEGDRIVPGQPGSYDRVLGEAAAGIVRQEPYERTADWLWRRGQGLAATYQAAMEEDGELTRKRGGRLSLGAKRVIPADTPARQAAADRWNAREPVLTALASAVGVEGVGAAGTEDRSGEVVRDEATTAVVAAVHDALMELEAVRQRRSIENAAFANLWRGP
ncbi:GPP34 family phosphoprotein [Streptomyces sp. NPDC087440]|uniref:GOLPH3/VPS74 family protein n=1 Tax=Streptomyces sp. NPDC087440 TaxID=3365790 RepID=UPI0037F7E6C5